MPLDPALLAPCYDMMYSIARQAEVRRRGHVSRTLTLQMRTTMIYAPGRPGFLLRIRTNTTKRSSFSLQLVPARIDNTTAIILLQISHPQRAQSRRNSRSTFSVPQSVLSRRTKPTNQKTWCNINKSYHPSPLVSNGSKFSTPPLKRVARYQG